MTLFSYKVDLHGVWENTSSLFTATGSQEETKRSNLSLAGSYAQQTSGTKWYYKLYNNCSVCEEKWQINSLSQENQSQCLQRTFRKDDAIANTKTYKCISTAIYYLKCNIFFQLLWFQSWNAKQRAACFLCMCEGCLKKKKTKQRCIARSRWGGLP